MQSFKMFASALALTAAAGAVAAQEANPEIDVNNDGFYSFPEVTTFYPEVTVDVFTQIDTTGDGLLDMAEVAAAQEAGLMPVEAQD
ncbi:hypothetical protein [Thalassorhabdomicrobium marinisediminis]|uniref:EF-hand domain-containing protein n=1 Tax=Thalassorhabdomicrobium marinisediminis TaxID=2170577 RepID=A0A2T7G100_9RHOB|nr:hypothetical protein [Thalassorhabdomicrobium marinisediminis]PVA08080.1 hypothetical protein DC363_00845 [Thalassorhabdomicrobium marinisediminis]